MKPLIIEKQGHRGGRRHMDIDTVCELVIVALYIIKIIFH
jgi:hypothetical protein